MKNVKKYSRILLRIAAYSLVGSLEYRFQTVVRIIRSIIEALLVLLLVAAFFNNTSTIGGWTPAGMLLTYSIFNLIFSTVNMFTSNSLEALDRHIRKGMLDTILIKPLDNQFYISFRQMHVQNIIRIIITFFLMVYAVSSLQIQIGVGDVVLFLVTFFSGIAICYSIFLMVATISFWSMSNVLFNIAYTTISVARYPMTLFPKWVILLVTIFPLIFVSTVPAKTLMGTRDWYTFLAPVVAITSLYVSRKFLFRGLRNYTSASS